jgi:hypothetical protein
MWSNPFITDPIAAMVAALIIVAMVLIFHHINRGSHSNTQFSASGMFYFSMEVNHRSVDEQRLIFIQEQQAIDRLLQSINNVIRAMPKYLRPSLRDALAEIDIMGSPYEVASRLASLIGHLAILASTNNVRVPEIFHRIADGSIHSPHPPELPGSYG